MNGALVPTEHHLCDVVVILEKPSGAYSSLHARDELHGQPIFRGWLGPMWDGDMIRYESPDTYAEIPNKTHRRNGTLWMAKLLKAQAKAHTEACTLLEEDVLTWNDKWLVLENWQESANHVNSAAGAVFTPVSPAIFSIDAGGGRVIDLCAAIGGLSFAMWSRMAWDGDDWNAKQEQFVCVEINLDYVEVGKKIMPPPHGFVAASSTCSTLRSGQRRHSWQRKTSDFIGLGLQARR